MRRGGGRTDTTQFKRGDCAKKRKIVSLEKNAVKKLRSRGIMGGPSAAANRKAFAEGREART